MIRSLIFPTKPIQLFSWLTSLTIWVISATISSVQAAERVEVRIDSVKFNISLKELETYAKQESDNKESAPLLSSISASDRQYIRQFLLLRSNFSRLEVAQFLDSAIGKRVLTYLGSLVQTDRNLNGAKAIRTGLIAAAADPRGLSLLTFVRKYPDATIRLDLKRGFEIANKIEQLAQDTQSAILGVEKLSSELARSEPKINSNLLPSLANPGIYPVKLQTEILNDARRDRRFIVDFYLPQGMSQPAPVVVLSHGLGADRQYFAATARHLASHGFIAVTVDHPGSDSQKVQKLLKGLTKEVFDVSEFIDRPKDVSYILDELNRRFPGLANTQQAGVIGHSFGGYTALALAGATIDFDYLTKQCNQGLDATNASLLLQCEALKLPRQSDNFRDPRIKFALAINPIDGSIFGPKGIAKIQIPVAIAAASEDVVAPPVLEQIQPFSWMVAPERYLFVVRGVGHTRDTRSLVRAFMPSLDSLMPDKNSDPLRGYARIFILALVQTHVANRQTYRAYLQAKYVAAISQSPNQLSMLRTLTPNQLNTIFAQKANKSGGTGYSKLPVDRSADLTKGRER